MAAEHPPYRCPLCRQRLDPSPASYRCAAGHSFDRAREGYVNLLPVQKKHSREPGDNAEMMQARRRFLAAGHYEPLREALGARLSELGLAAGAALLDLGCGEGWYSGGLAARLPDLCLDGIDISKPAVKLAARAWPACRFAVASSHDLPFADGAFAAALNVFAPLEAAELQRVLAPGGYLLRVSAAPEHLFALKALLYAEPQQHSDELTDYPGFELRSRERLQARFELGDAGALRDLIQMTPYAWKLQGEPDLASSLPLSIGLDVYLSLYQRRYGLDAE